MDNFKNATLDTLSVSAIGAGITMAAGAGDKWYIGVVLILAGVGISYTKYFVREEK
jgi:hypothetical protein